MDDINKTYINICKSSFKQAQSVLKNKDKGGNSFKSLKKLKEVVLDIEAIRSGEYIIQ